MAVQAVTDATFEAEVLRSELPVLVDLYADWCQPCKQLSPIVAQVAEEIDRPATPRSHLEAGEVPRPDLS